jgi:hypothetical protein
MPRDSSGQSSGDRGSRRIAQKRRAARLAAANKRRQAAARARVAAEQKAKAAAAAKAKAAADAKAKAKAEADRKAAEQKAAQQKAAQEKAAQQKAAADKAAEAKRIETQRAETARAAEAQKAAAAKAAQAQAAPTPPPQQQPAQLASPIAEPAQAGPTRDASGKITGGLSRDQVLEMLRSGRGAELSRTRTAEPTQRLSRDELETQSAAAAAKQVQVQDRGREAVDTAAQAKNLLQTATQTAGGNFGREGLQVGAEDVGTLQGLGKAQSAAADVNRIDLEDPEKQEQLQEVRQMASNLGMSEEETNKALSAKLGQRGMEAQFASLAGKGGNIQDTSTAATNLVSRQITKSRGELGEKGNIVANLAALNPDVYKKVDLNDELHLLNLSKPLNMLRDTNSDTQLNRLNNDPSESSWADVVGTKVLPAAVGTVLSLATGGAASPLLAGLGTGGAIATQGALTAAAYQGLLAQAQGGDPLKGALMGAGGSLIGSGAGALTEGLGTLGGEGIAGETLRGAVKGGISSAGEEALGALVQGDDFSFGDIAKGAATGGLAAGATSLASDFLEGTSIGDTFGIGEDTDAPITEVAPSALEVEASPGDIGPAGSGAPITASNMDLARLSVTDLGFGTGAGIASGIVGDTPFGGGSFSSTHEQEGPSTVAPTGQGIDDIGGESAIPQETVVQAPAGPDAGGFEQLDMPSATDPDMFLGVEDSDISRVISDIVPDPKVVMMPWGMTAIQTPQLDPISAAETAFEEAQGQFAGPQGMEPITGRTGSVSLDPLTSGNVAEVLPPHMLEDAIAVGTFGPPTEPSTIAEAEFEDAQGIFGGLHGMEESMIPITPPGEPEIPADTPMMQSDIDPTPQELEFEEAQGMFGGQQGMEEQAHQGAEITPDVPLYDLDRGGIAPPPTPPEIVPFVNPDSIGNVLGQIVGGGLSGFVPLPDNEPRPQQGGTLTSLTSLMSSTAGQADPTSELQQASTGGLQLNPRLMSGLAEFGLSEEEKKKRQRLWMANPLIEGV